MEMAHLIFRVYYSIPHQQVMEATSCQATSYHQTTYWNDGLPEPEPEPMNPEPMYYDPDLEPMNPDPEPVY